MRMTFGQLISNCTLLDDRLDLGLRWRWRRRRTVLRFVRQESERHAEDVDVLRLEQACLWVDLVRYAAEPAPDHLLAEQLAGEGAQAHDVRHGLASQPSDSMPTEITF